MKRWLCRLWVVFCFGSFSAAVEGQTNYWTNSVSGPWETPTWSLGYLPGTNQSVFITNAWQAVAIGPSTVSGHRESLQVDQLTIAAPSNSLNALLMNYAGTDHPLVIGGGPYPGCLIVATNSTFEMHSSALQILNGIMPPYNNVQNQYGAFSVGGTFSQSDYSLVSSRFLHVGDIGSGVYNLTNGLAAIDYEFIGGSYGGVFNQLGGSNLTTLEVDDGGQYNFYDGSLQGGMTVVGGQITQFGGVISNSFQLARGGYTLLGGLFITSGLIIPQLQPNTYFGGGTFTQSGGTNITGAINVRASASLPFSYGGSMALSNGLLLASGTVRIEGAAGFLQTGGNQTNAGLSLNGSTDIHGPQASQYTMSGGSLSTASISINQGTFVQSGGSNVVAGDVNVSGGGGASSGVPYPLSICSLSGGALSDRNTTINDAAGGGNRGSQPGGFFQSGGTHAISDLLFITGGSAPGQEGYLLAGGQLTVPKITIQGAGFHHTSGTLTTSGLLTMNGGVWDEQTVGESVGALKLATGPAESLISLANGNCSLVFANSSAQAWTNTASLIVSNWHGSVGGGGASQLRFGNNASGLTPQQLSQISFVNPGGQSGRYPAMILSTGEVVPDRFLMGRLAAGKLVLEWPAGMTLQSSTNVLGTYQDVNASSPYTVSATEPQRFYRLRR